MIHQRIFLHGDDFFSEARRGRTIQRGTRPGEGEWFFLVGLLVDSVVKFDYEKNIVASVQEESR